MTHAVSHAHTPSVCAVIFKLAAVWCMTGAKTELSYYTHCAALLFLAALGLTGLMQDVAACVLQGKWVFPVKYRTKRRKDQAILIWPALQPDFQRQVWHLIYCEVVTLVMSRTNHVMWDIILWILKKQFTSVNFHWGVHNSQLMDACLYWWP